MSGFTITGGVEITNSIGNVVLQDLSVSNPDGDGIKISDTWWYYDEEEDDYYLDEGPKYSGTVTLTDVDSSGNLGSGAYIWSLNAITITNSTFNNNGGTDGVDDPVNSVFLDTSWGKRGIILNGVSASNNNGSGFVITVGGSSTITNVIANNNTAPSFEPGEDGLDYGFGLYLLAPGGVFKLENIITDKNELRGMNVNITNGTLVIKTIEAISNGGHGIEIYNQGAISIQDSQTNDNPLNGINIVAGKTVTLSSIVSSYNGNSGLCILPYEIWQYDEIAGEDVFVGYLGPTSVTLTSPTAGGIITTNSFEGNTVNGVYIRAKGNITVSNLDSFNNGNTGIYLDNCLYDKENGVYYGKGNVTVNVTISGWYNGARDNNGKGIEIYSLGAVKIEDTGAEINGDNGIYVDTQNTINLSDVSSSMNNGYGAYLTNLSAAKAKPVSITDSNFDSNNNTGVMVLTAGAISFNGSSANSNISPSDYRLSSYPISLDDYIFSKTSSENWYFYGNAGDALDIILQSGDIDVYLTLYDSSNNVIASDDNGYGGTDARIEVVLGSDDDYRIEVSYSGMEGDYGIYTLSINDENYGNSIFPGAGAILVNSAGTAGVTISTTKIIQRMSFNDNQDLD